MQFLIAVQDHEGRWHKKGFVAFNRRCIPDSRLKDFFPPNTRGYENLLKSCRFLAGDKAAQSVDWQYRSLMVRTHKID
jgi:hypothetical protein